MKVAMTGASGLIGSAFATHLRAAGHDVRPLTRGPAGAWDPSVGRLDRSALDGLDVVVTLAGERLVGRWTEAKKRRIRESRVIGTRLVAEAIAGLDRKPRVLLAASAVGYYGDRGTEELTEASPPGDDELARLVREWEAATAPATAAGVRVVSLRFGVVLSPGGGALAALLPFFRLGLGGPVGGGAQYFSWIALDDVVAALGFLLGADSISGPVNVTAPHPVPNRDFARALGRVLRRPALLPVPPLALRLRFGTEAAWVLQSGQRMLPARLLAAGYRFRFAEVEPALRHLLAAPAGAS